MQSFIHQANSRRDMIKPSQLPPIHYLILKQFLVGALSILLLGCASQVVSSSRGSVIIQDKPLSRGKSDDLAVAECQKYGRSAVLTSRPDNTMRSYYQCVD
mgnify:FL=1